MTGDDDDDTRRAIEEVNRPAPNTTGWKTIASMSAADTARWLSEAKEGPNGEPLTPAPMRIHDPATAAKVEAMKYTVRRVVDLAIERRVDPNTRDGQLQFAGMLADALDNVDGWRTASRIRQLVSDTRTGLPRAHQLLQALTGQLLLQADVGAADDQEEIEG